MTIRTSTTEHPTDFTNFFTTLFDWSVVDKTVSSGNFSIVNAAGDPAYNYEIELYAKTFFGEKLLAKTTTDKQGKFTFKYRQYAKSFTENEQAIIKVKNIVSRGLNAHLNPIGATIDLNKKFAEKKYSFKKDIQIELKEYNLDPKSYPEDLADKDLITPDDEWFIKTALNSLWPISIEALGTVAKQFGWSIHEPKTWDELVKLHNLPMDPVKYTDKILLDMITNGIAALPFKLGKEKGQRIVEVKWDPKGIDQSPDAPDVPNLEITLKETENGLEILSIHIQRLKKNDQTQKNESVKNVRIEILNSLNDEINFDEQEKKFTYDDWTFTKNDKNWEGAIQTATCVLFMDAELRRHLTKTHLVAGATTFAGNRGFIRNPFKRLLDPSDEGIPLVNRLGKNLIFEKIEGKNGVSEGGVLAILGLTKNGIHDEIIDCMKDCLEAGTTTDIIERFKGDKFAEKAKLTYDTFLVGMKTFMDNNKDKIIEHWYEVHYVFKNIRENRLGKTKWKIPEIAMDKGRPQGKDWENVAIWFANYMYLASSGHNDVHSKQDIILKYSGITLAPRLGEDGVVKGSTAGATIEELNKQYLIARILLAFNNDQRMKDKSILNHPDVVVEVKKAFNDALSKFKDLGVDLKSTPISIYI